MTPSRQAGLWSVGALTFAALLLRIGWIESGVIFGCIAVLLVIVALELRRA